MLTVRSVLQCHVTAKDNLQPPLMREIHASNAILTFSIATGSIGFPERVLGLDRFTRTLVVYFGKTFSRCRTFFVCDSIPEPEAAVVSVPWPVLMREPAYSCLRIGKGYYQWTFEHLNSEKMRIAAMHIHSGRMKRVADVEGRLLSTMQSNLPYPWVACRSDARGV